MYFKQKLVKFIEWIWTNTCTWNKRKRSMKVVQDLNSKTWICKLHIRSMSSSQNKIKSIACHSKSSLLAHNTKYCSQCLTVISFTFHLFLIYFSLTFHLAFICYSVCIHLLIHLHFISFSINIHSLHSQQLFWQSAKTRCIIFSFKHILFLDNT